jgi:hypothetical protein
MVIKKKEFIMPHIAIKEIKGNKINDIFQHKLNIPLIYYFG